MNKFVFVFAALFALALCDMYGQGCLSFSNNRNNEANTNRNNANRLFDSQNNGKGGYCRGPAMTLYVGSIVTIMWSNQHGCGRNPRLNCQIVMQYMCGANDADPKERIRDGTTTDTIPNNIDNLDDTDPDNPDVLLYGMHESFAYYRACEARDRNGGLYIADRNVGRDATRTRQNNGGTRRGFECPEERDYYPYWHPTPWVDIVVFTHDEQYCEFYQEESQNVKSKHFCKLTDPALEDYEWFSDCNIVECCTGEDKEWVEVPAHGVPPPDCLIAPWSALNHLGFGLRGQFNSYNWTVPAAPYEELIDAGKANCVFRMRYNISTSDTAENYGAPTGADFVDASKNGELAFPKQDPYADYLGYTFSLAINTNQFGRTFQDRSHIFHIENMPSNVPGLAKVYVVCVRGKRGNIVQAYPATEYVYQPEEAHFQVGDMVHFHWTGCDTNPNGNAGEGTAGTDRSNVVFMKSADHSFPAPSKFAERQQRQNQGSGSYKQATDTPNGDNSGRDEIDDKYHPFSNQTALKYLAFGNQQNCLSYEDLAAKNNNNNNQIEQDEQNCMKLNAMEQMINGGVLRVERTGSYSYYSTRNNNFTNRGQKGTIVVDSLLDGWPLVVIAIGAGLFVCAGLVAGAVLWARMNPHSGAANVVSKF